MLYSKVCKIIAWRGLDKQGPQHFSKTQNSCVEVGTFRLQHTTQCPYIVKLLAAQSLEHQIISEYQFKSNFFKSEHPHPNLDCLSSTYPGKKIRAALTWPWARAGSAGPRGPHPYSPYPRGIRSGPRARTTGAPNPERARGRDNEKEMKGKWDRMLLTVTGADIASPPLSKEEGSLNVGFWGVKM